MRTLVVCLLLAVGAAAQTYDTLLTGCRVFDGAGTPWFRADVGVAGDRIVAVGRLTGATARLTRDCHGLALAAGFIDIHSHARRGILAHPQAENQLRQGVTTVIEGPDGSSPLPIAAFLREVAAAKPAINFGTMVGQGSVREAVLGTEDRRATAAEIERMRGIVRQAMRDGAFGLSTGLFYVPGAFTPVEEVIELAKVAGDLGGIHVSHMREEAAHVRDSVRETIRIGEEGKLPTQITHHKIIGQANWGASADTLRLVEEARARGVDVTLDQYPYTASATGTVALFPQWSQAGGRKAFLGRLADGPTRARIKAEIVGRIRDDRGGGDPKNVVMASCPHDPALDGLSLAAIADRRGLSPTIESAAEAAIDIQTRGGCSAIYHSIAEEDVERILRSPYTMIASDGGIPGFGEGKPHPRNYGTFARVLGRYVRERKILSLEEAVRKMSGMPAQRLGLGDRGLVRPGMKADLVVFDPATIADRATFAEPHQFAAGVVHVFVNGRAALLDGKLVAERAGRILYGPAKN